MDRQLIGAAKAVSYFIVWVAAAVTLYRGIVGPLWGSQSDYGLFGAVAAGALGLIGLAWLASILAKDVTSHFQSQPKKRKTK